MARVGRRKIPVDIDELRVLGYLVDAAPGPRRKTIASTSVMAAALGFSPAKLKVVRKVMAEKGLIEIEERWAESGAQMENAYRVTRKGRLKLAEVREAVGEAPSAASVKASDAAREAGELEAGNGPLDCEEGSK